MAISKSTIPEIREVFISKVVLENFLSFEKDEVDFGNSKFNLIIGPNWSGKTSIFQAIKFGLGSNERDERYSRWADFIRTGQKHARVELHVKDKGKNIIIQRTVIRGKSPYYAIKKWSDKNFKKTPTIEVQKLIKELNFNPDNHFAFVSQGKVDAIKNLKPIELCTFLEEGIGLRGLREEILQQKNDVSELHAELNSIVTQKNTLNITLDLLRPKLERLEKKKKLLEVRKIHEDELLWANRKTLEKEISALEENIIKIKVQADILNYEVKKCKKEIDEFKTKITEIEKGINEHSEKLGELNYKKKELIKTIQDWQRDKIKAKQDLDDSTEVIGKKEKVLKNFESQKGSLDKEIAQITKEKDMIESKFDELLKEQSELAIKIERNKEFLKKYEQKISEKTERNKKILDTQKIIKDATTEINQIFQSLKDIDHKLDNNSWFLENPTKNLLRTFDNELGKISAKIFSLDHAIDQMEKDKAKKIRQLKPLQSSLRERKVVLPTNITILKEEINKRELRAKGPIIDYLKYDDELSYAIESVIGEKLLYSFVAENWDTLTLLKKLKNKYNAYCNIYVPKNLKVSPLMKITGKGVVGYLAELVKIMDDDTDIKKVIYSKVKNCLVMKDFTSGQELYKNGGFKGKCVTLKGEQIISYKYVFETPHVKQLKGLLSAGTQKEQSKNLESEIKTLNDTISERKVDQSKLDGIQREIFKKKEAFNDLLYNFNQKQRLTTKKNQLYEYNYA